MTSATRLKPITDRDRETLRALDAANRNHENIGYRQGWAKPMDCGGWNGSHHSATLKKLVRRGLAEIESPSEKRPGCSRYFKGGCFYRITAAGRKEIGKRS